MLIEHRWNMSIWIARLGSRSYKSEMPSMLSEFRQILGITLKHCIPRNIPNLKYLLHAIEPWHDRFCVCFSFTIQEQCYLVDVCEMVN